MRECFYYSCSQAQGEFECLDASVASFILEPQNSLTLIQLLSQAGSPYEADSCPARMTMRELCL